MLSAYQILSCVRPQFVWDCKSSGKWLLLNSGRDHYFFQKDLGIMVFIHITRLFQCAPGEVQLILEMDDYLFSVYGLKLDELLTKNNWQTQQIHVKTGLVKNLIRYKFNAAPPCTY